jgi:hypothetical protein
MTTNPVTAISAETRCPKRATLHTDFEDGTSEQRFDDIRWDVRQTIHVQFLGGHSSIHRKVKNYARR